MNKRIYISFTIFHMHTFFFVRNALQLSFFFSERSLFFFCEKFSFFESQKTSLQTIFNFTFNDSASLDKAKAQGKKNAKS